MAGLVELLGVTHWPGVKRDQIAPAIHKFVTEGRLLKDSQGFYTTPAKKVSG